MTAAFFYGEGKRKRKISPFIYETMTEEEVEKAVQLKTETQQQLSIFDFKPVEPQVPTQKLSLKNFSFSQLESYKTCPLQYKYQYLLKIPTPANAAASFGDTIHRTLQQFYLDYMADASLGLDHSLFLYKKLWSPLGYTSKEYEDKMKKEGEEMLKKFFVTFHPPSESILSLEKLFKVKMADDVFVTGKIDRVDKNMDTGELEIIDYKTGRLPDEKELQKSLQLSLYAFAAHSPSLYNQPLNKVKLTFYYLQDMKKISITRTEEDIVKVKEDVTTMVEEIRGSSFTPKVGVWCSYCPFKMICEAWR